MTDTPPHCGGLDYGWQYSD